MIPFFTACLAVITPLIFFFLPGIGIATVHEKRHLLAWTARVVLWSISLAILATFTATAFGYSSAISFSALALMLIVGLWVNRRRFFTMPTAWYTLAVLAGFLIVYTGFSIPYLLGRQGEPTGDAQKTIYWAQRIQATHTLPNYNESLVTLNRDPVDFYTPGLHTLASALMDISPLPLTSVGLLAIIASICAATVAAAIAKDIFDTDGKLFPATVVILLVLTNIRFLRYLREPGYHLQNIIGELLLFGLVYIGLALIHRYRTKDVILGVLCLAALLGTHQFSSFIGAFALVPVVIAFLISRRHMFAKALQKSVGLSVLCVIAAAAAITLGYILGLAEKIPHLFTATPHLLNELPTLGDYPRLLGGWWLVIGLAGWALLIIHSARKHQHYRETWALSFSIALLFVLSQAPRFYIDIPPVRALFYLCIPLSITGAYFIATIGSYLKSLPLSPKRVSIEGALTICLIVGLITSLTNAYVAAPLDARTNSTLTPELQYIIEHANKLVPSGAIITDDYGKRAASWFLLSGRPTFSRLASDIHRPMQESRQNTTRRQMYLNQLDFEKIYSLGNWPGITSLLKKHAISSVAGVAGTSYSVFAANPALTQTAWADNLQLFSVNQKTDSDTTGIPPGTANWLLKPSTLANDIGDDEDTQDFLPASLPTTRLGNPVTANHQTYRLTSAPIIPLDFNMADYSAALWDQDGNGQPDTTVELFVKLAFPTNNLTLGSANTPLSSTTNIIKLAASDIQVNSQGHLIITLNNPTQEPVAIDMIALGLARVP